MWLGRGGARRGRRSRGPCDARERWDRIGGRAEAWLELGLLGEWKACRGGKGGVGKEEGGEGVGRLSIGVCGKLVIYKQRFFRLREEARRLLPGIGG